ncbi:hypothetical protein TVAG_247960 [Trichomonas vaginalis G3]|uniref:DNA-directed primase/polymerase protein n=1 Tax=Trichomonas vaginalis (strain ATCC PRA-98 / G3) TaxID=412133 RepID=A2FRF1_TRIV3|nr:DNA-directed primase / polymerase protein family [Trichomonas vaginalis G3]EAX92515.1 hypothetical protein TVAG_247960 [Trichomonas vaginalis G3]KAI5540782.1 DNA-directed primase / polymerase protein family [Trichomonas vaginalis G3]|eukprot:XP_001305445.1 hypothetical protein [Trichomonas vaginalis G3]
MNGSDTSVLTSNADFFISTLISYTPDRELIGYEDMLVTTDDGKKKITNVKEMPGSHQISLAELDGLGIEDFILKAFDITGSISKCDYNEGFNTLLFGISGCRYCRNIGREHKSNGIYILAKLTSGVAVQRCYDPDCRFFESQPVIIPPKILDETRRKYDKYYTQKTEEIPVPEDISAVKTENCETCDSEVLPSELFKDGIAISPSLFRSPLRQKQFPEINFNNLLSSSDEEIIINEDQEEKQTVLSSSSEEEDSIIE